MKEHKIIFEQILTKCNLAYRHPEDFMEISKLPIHLQGVIRRFYQPIFEFTEPLQNQLGKDWIQL